MFRDNCNTFCITIKYRSNGLSKISRIIKLIDEYSDLPADLADTTLIVAAETVKVEQIISLHKDFDVYQMNNRKHFINLLG